MPASRSPVRPVISIPYQSSPAGVNGSGYQCNFSSYSPAVVDYTSAPPTVSPPAKRRRTPNAFILYRSHVIAKKQYPPELIHQNDISRYVAEQWRGKSAAERSAFFRMAEVEKLRAEHAAPRVTPRKKRRSKPRKTDVSRTHAPHEWFTVAESSGSASDKPIQPVLDSHLCLSTSSANAPASNFGPFAVAPNDALASGLAEAPQAVRPIPPHLLNWGCDVENRKGNTVDPNQLASCVPSYDTCHLMNQGDGSCFGNLDLEMQVRLNFQLSLDTNATLLPALPSPDVTSNFFQYPPFNTFPLDLTRITANQMSL